MRNNSFIKTSLLALVATSGCAAQSASQPSTVACIKNKSVQAASLQYEVGQQHRAFDLGSPDVVVGMQALRGYVDLTWVANGVPGQKRCVMSLIPDVERGTKVKVVTAGHCLPELPKTTGTEAKVKVHVAYNGGFIPLQLEVPTLDLALSMASLINKYLVSHLSQGSLGSWLPEYATGNCEKWTEKYKTETGTTKSIACFSRQDLRIIDATVSETSEKSLGLYAKALEGLDRVKGRALSEAPQALSQDVQMIWRAHNINDMRRRNLRALSYLSNVQYCAPGVSTIDPQTNEPDTRKFCEMAKDIRDSFFNFSASAEEMQRLQEIINDSTTPVQQLRDQFLGCDRTPLSRADEMTACEVSRAAKEAFNKWIRDAQTTFDALSETEKRGLGFQDYFKIVAADRSNPSRPAVQSLSVLGNSEGHTLGQKGYIGGFLFQYDPAKGYFSFEKGDSGSVLNVFSGIPAAVLSTINGEPTSGGATVMPLPEPDAEDIPSSSSVCR